MNILITGSDGVIGGQIKSEFKKYKEYEIYSTSNKKKIKKRKNTFYQDLTKTISVEPKPDTIIHCASKHPFSKNQKTSKNMYDINLKMTQNLIKYSNKNNVKNIIFLSSIDVYGKIESKKVIENLKPLKQNLYGKSKKSSEDLFCKKSNNFNTICIRVPGVFNFDLKRNHPLIIRIVKTIVKNKDVEIYNPKSIFNNIIDVEEIVKFITVVLKKKKN